MRVVPIPDELRDEEWVVKTTVFAAPNGDLTDNEIAPAEAIHYAAVTENNNIVPCVGVVLLLSEEDIEAIKGGAHHLLMSFPGNQLPVFNSPEILHLGDYT